MNHQQHQATWIDTHAHLDMEAFDGDRDETLARLDKAGVAAYINICLGPELARIEAGLGIAREHKQVFAAIGVHPHQADEHRRQETIEHIAPYFDEPKVVAVGEIGLDYYYDNSDRGMQRSCFEEWIEFALTRGLPICVHTRDAFEDTLAILKASEVCEKVGGVIHCFTGDRAQAKAFVDLGAHISFSGIVTFQNAQDIQDAARWVPSERILVETDAPYLTPVPHRGQRNEPAYVKEVGEFVAKLRGAKVSDFALQTSHNAQRLFAFSALAKASV